jgi:hypothetical protein
MRMTGTKTDGSAVDLWFRQTLGLVKRDGRWMVSHQHASCHSPWMEAVARFSISNLNSTRTDENWLPLSENSKIAVDIPVCKQR